LRGTLLPQVGPCCAAIAAKDSHPLAACKRQSAAAVANERRTCQPVAFAAVGPVGQGRCAAVARTPPPAGRRARRTRAVCRER